MPNPNTATQEDLDTPNDTMLYEVSRDVLPIHCPMPGSSLWNSHPQVYIPVEVNGSAKCPYCGCEYRLVD
jgi:uncharacterized Zn-finger protein